MIFRFGNKAKKREFKLEIERINEEINRSKRFDFNFGVLAVEVSHSVPQGLSKLLPGKTISFHLLKKYLRGYDKMLGPFLRRYFILLPQADGDGVDAVKTRIYRLALENNWGTVATGTAVYPEDGKNPQALLDKAISRIS